MSLTPKITFSPPASGTEGALTSSVWSPPACYYAPVHTPAEAEAYWTAVHNRIIQAPFPQEDKDSARDGHEARFGEDGEFPDFHRDREGEGMFWMRVMNEDYPAADRFACEWRLFWVDFSDPPPADALTVSGETLAALAWEQTRVPDTELSLNPEAEQTVNLATWVWLDGEQFAPVSVRASLDGYGIWARTTARPVAMRLDAGTDDAVLHPANGRCEVRGSAVGEPYARGRSGEDPPCGVTYLRSTHRVGSYRLAATVTWEVTWEDHTGAGGTLPDGIVDGGTDVTVQEVQAIVR
ncbi:hypothetical protein [Streptomyces calidiresistens]|uniref:Uncharacterized protein n=1 Tax=Streptomyces calidiresistens TaxID=1485586 RepID=A0A7W3XVW9_9ACTN|nr:hypothetical protein [Streptomyces calidiresistens]MBB0229238.1 hypothetical protein [Streptomyces calidiresistens]